MKVAEMLIGGAVTIGIITALVLPGRSTAQVTKAGFQGAQGLLGTAITGKA